MAKLLKEIKDGIANQELFCVATSNAQGVPNVVYIKYLKVIDDETILIADNYLKKTRENILNNGRIAFSVLDEDKGAYQLKGRAQRQETGAMYDEVQKWCPDKLPRAAAVVMKVEEIYNGAERIC